MEDHPKEQEHFEGEACYRHPERKAIETCEVCGDALCGYCLYYTNDGQRLCEKHAQVARANGLRIIPPAMYADGIIPSQAEAARNIDTEATKGVFDKKRPIYQGNNQDLQAFVGMVVGITTLVTCCSGSCCTVLLPIVPLALGILSLANARDAVDPRRTRQQAWISIIIGGLFTLFAVAIFAFYMLVFAGGFSSISTTTFGNPVPIIASPTVTVAPTATHTPGPNVEPSQLTATARAASETATP